MNSKKQELALYEMAHVRCNRMDNIFFDKDSKGIKYPLVVNTWGEEEQEAIIKVVKSGNLTMGKYVKEFEKKFAKYVGTNYAVMTNSGSSANLLMLAVLKYKYNFKDGDIIVPTVSWSTTYFPIHQNGFKLNFVDIDRYTLNIDTDKIEKVITPKTRAIFAVNLLGNPCEFDKLKAIAKKHNILLLEDNCEGFGGIYKGKLTGSFGKMASHSFFFSHHIQTMEGGMVTTNNKNIVDYLKSLRAHGWCRDLSKNSSLYTKTKSTFKDAYTFVLPGYCVRPIEMEAAVGIVQLKRFKDFKEQRLRNRSYFIKIFGNSDLWDIQKEVWLSSWFGFAIILKGRLENKRDEIVRTLIKNGIESRPIVAGNFMKNPCIKYLDYIDNNDYAVADYIDKNGIYFGNYSYCLLEALEYTYKIIKENYLS